MGRKVSGARLVKGVNKLMLLQGLKTVAVRRFAIAIVNDEGSAAKLIEAFCNFASD